MKDNKKYQQLQCSLAKQNSPLQRQIFNFPGMQAIAHLLAIALFVLISCFCQPTLAATSEVLPIPEPEFQTFDVGRDTGTPVVETYQVPFAFTGNLQQVTLDLKA
jgi:hypothetical protein